MAEAIGDAGLSLRQVAHEAHIPLTTLHRRLAAESPFLVTELGYIAGLLGIPVSELILRAEGAAA